MHTKLLTVALVSGDGVKGEREEREGGCRERVKGGSGEYSHLNARKPTIHRRYYRPRHSYSECMFTEQHKLTLL